MNILLIIIIAVLLTELWLRPRVDKISNGKVLLWYGKRRRRYIVLKN